MNRFGTTTGFALATMLCGGAAAQHAPLTVQQQFEAASAASAGSDKAAALAAWVALEPRVANNPRNLAIVRIHESAVLLELDRKDEAAAAARAGLAALPAADATLANERFLGQLMLARIAQAALDYATAAEAFRAAEAVATAPADRIVAALGVVDTETFVDPAAAEAALGRIDTFLATIKSEPAVRGRVAVARGVLLLNQGRFVDARKELKAAVVLYGGLTAKTDLNDVAARSDTAIAALLSGDAETAREYMAYTGAGQIVNGNFNPGVQMTPPDCGGEAGLKPADIAVVEFSVGEDGSVIQVAPVYAAGGNAVALEFARAAQRWSWTPEQVKEMPRFFRYRARVEMRCSTGFTRPSIGTALDTAVSRWLTDKNVALPPPPEGSAVAALPMQRAALAKANGLDAIAAGQPLIDSPFLPSDEKHRIAVQSLAIADANAVPPLARLDLDLAVRATANTEGQRSKDFRADLATMLTMPVYANDPRARAAIRLFAAEWWVRRPDQQTRDRLQQVADDPALAETDPMKVAALLQIASLKQRDGDIAAAKAAFDRTGLTADQCALIAAPPAFLSAGGTFPAEAQRWGFEGWTLTQFDIAANGHVQGQRAIISYPPFIFTKAGEETIAGARYAKSYRPDGALGCGSAMQRVKFALPFRH